MTEQKTALRRVCHWLPRRLALLVAGQERRHGATDLRRDSRDAARRQNCLALGS